MERKPSDNRHAASDTTSFGSSPSETEFLSAQMVGMPGLGDEILGGKYVVERVIGVGGMGVVVSAIHKKLGQRVAVKFLSRSMQTTDLVDRFIREGQACARIKSEHIAPVLDVGVLENGTPYLMMEYLEGVDLDGYMTDHGLVPHEDAVDFILQACDALASAHAVGIVHRDLKPSNLFVTMRSDGSPLIKVLDFGISKMGAHESNPNPKATLTRPGTMLGSPRYAAPEQLRNASSVDHRADIWALGIVLQEIVAGQPPYESDNFADLCALITIAPPTPLRQVKPDAPALLEAIILKCLQKKADDRYQDVAELANALVPLASDEARLLSLRIGKILGLASNRTPPGTYVSMRAPNATPHPPSSPDSERRSGRSDPTVMRDSRRAVPPPSDSNVSALAVSRVNSASGRRTWIGGVAVAVLLLLALGISVARRLTSAPSTVHSTSLATMSSVPEAPPPTASAAPSFGRVELPVASAPLEATAAAPRAAPVPKAAKPKAAVARPPTASATAPLVPPSADAPAPPSESDILNRRR